MLSKFYSTIIEEERKKFGITNDRLKTAARVIGSTYSKSSLEKGSTHVNYNNPEYRCAYLYKYASLHTGMVTKYFRKFVKKEIRNHFRRGIKICSLGGGPGTDFIGICKALAVNPYFENRINQVSILDICGGWCITFENIITGLLKGRVKGVPQTFINKKKFKHEYIEIDLLQSLPENIVEIISKADIISMVKFISVLQASEGCLNVFKVLGNLLKPGATVLFIDNAQGNTFESITGILNEVGLEIVFGPLHELFYQKHHKEHNEELYGCLAQTAAKISVVGLMKKDLKILPGIIFSLKDTSCSSRSEQGFISISVSSDEEDNNGNVESNHNTYCDKFVQTELEDCNDLFDGLQASLQCEMEELSTLTEALIDLLLVIKKIKKNGQPNHLSSKCHSKHYIS